MNNWQNGIWVEANLKASFMNACMRSLQVPLLILNYTLYLTKFIYTSTRQETSVFESSCHLYCYLSNHWKVEASS